jgi:putative ATP-binding cassette transporter
MNTLTEIPWRRLYKITVPLFKSNVRGTIIRLLVTIFALMMGNIVLDMIANYLSGEVAKYVRLWDLHQFTLYFLLSVGVAWTTGPVQVYAAQFRTQAALVWRDWFSGSLIHAWYDAVARPYFWITTKLKDVANPDQRMTQDPDSYANSTIGLTFSFVDAFSRMISWGSILIFLSYFLTGAAIFCAIISSILTVVIGKSLVALTYRLMDTEADLRFSAGRARENAESIAFGRGEAVNESLLKEKLKRVIRTLLEIMRVNRNMQLFTTTWNLTMPLVPTGIMVYMAPGPIDFDLIVRAAGAFTGFYNATNVFASQFGGLASYFAIVNRLGVFTEAIEWAGQDPLPGRHLDVKIGENIAFKDATILRADSSNVLVSKLNLKVCCGESILVYFTGKGAPGKTTFLRTIAGITNNGTSGSMERPPSDKVMFLNSPDLPEGTLSQTLSYPLVDEIADKELLQRTLNAVGLSSLPTRFNGFDTVVPSWKEVLSTTEQQRIVLARILLQKPRYVIIDDDILDEETERLMYTTLTAINATIVTTGSPVKTYEVTTPDGQRKQEEVPATILHYVQKVLQVNEDGTWKLVTASEYDHKEERRQIEATKMLAAPASHGAKRLAAPQQGGDVTETGGKDA